MYKLIEFTDEQTYVDLFLSLPSALYQNDKNYHAENKSDVMAWLAGRHPCADFLVSKNFLVVRETRAIVRTIVRGIAFFNRTGGWGSVGFFECENEPAAVQLLIDAAKEFCVAHGAAKIYAPMNGSIWSNYRLMTKGFAEKTFWGEPYNKEYYADVLLSCGFRVAKTWETQLMQKISAKGSAAKRYQTQEKSQREKGIAVRPLKNFDEDIRVIYQLAMNAFAEFFLFHPVEERVFVSLYQNMRIICDKRTVRLAYNAANEPIGFGIALPNYTSTLGYLLKYARHYIFLYLGTLQKNGESVYPQCGKAIMMPILTNLYLRRKGLICALMGEDAKTRGFASAYDSVREYALLELGALDWEGN